MPTIVVGLFDDRITITEISKHFYAWEFGGHNTYLRFFLISLGTGRGLLGTRSLSRSRAIFLKNDSSPNGRAV